MIHPIYPGLILRNHYTIVRELGQGGFGRTYLAKDQHRFDEFCVLKEFAPQAQGSYALKKSQELFEREAEILYKLKHSQIPRFRELFRETLNDQGYLFFVQDYVEGSNYRNLLNQRLRQGIKFTEAEAIQLLLQLLPVLDYIHSYGVIHRDISPDNIIQRQTDGLPILIDFGGVKLIQAKVESEFSPDHVSSPATRLGKVGYAPDEQMRMGIVYPHSDLYGLAATILVLLTGVEPQQLIDHHNLTWNWKKYINLTPQFGEILDQMLAQRPSDRFQSAQAVLSVLGSFSNPVIITPTQPPPELKSQPQTQTQTQTQTQPPMSSSTPIKKLGLTSAWGTTLLVFVSVLMMGGLGWLGGISWLNHYQKSKELKQIPSPGKEQEEALRDQRRLLNIDFQFFVNLVNEEFYTRYPDQSGRTLTDAPEDAIWRRRWNQIADEFLHRLENLTDESRVKLGAYSTPELDDWKKAVNQVNLSSRALYDLADAKFFYLFPEQPRNANLLGLSIGQVWLAITDDTVDNIKTGTKLKSVQFASEKTRETLKGRLQPGEGKAYIARLSQNQTLQVRLQAPKDSTLLSIYTPGNTGKVQSLLEDSKQTRWSGRLDDYGYYEFVVVSEASKPLDYELILQAQ